MTLPETDEAIRRFLRALAVVLLPSGLLMAHFGWADLVMLQDWPRREAVVAAAAPFERWRGVEDAVLILRAETEAGPVERRAIRIHPIVPPWSAPHQAPLPGDRLTVVIDPDNPQRMATVESLRWSWPAVAAMATALLIGGAAALALLHDLLQRRRLTGPAASAGSARCPG